MSFFGRKKKADSTAANVYGMIDNELRRLHELFRWEMNTQKDANNANLTWKVILEFHKALLKVCEVSDQQTQQKIAEMVLIGDNGGATKDN